MPKLFDQKSLVRWFQNEKRDLPWRNNSSPYAVWVSEVMLQQTQVAVVIPYYERWMQRFPTVHALASASIEEVIKQWEGLGYYSRARHLHEGARYVVERHQGILPDDPQSLAEIKGLGDYTIGAILSFAFHQKHPAVDGNVMRVLTRYFNIAEDISKSKVQRQIRSLAAEILPDASPWLMAEALIELGATVCQRKPRCKECPLKASCIGYRLGTAEQLPFKSVKMRTEFLFRAVAILEHQGRFLVRCVQKGEIMSGLHEFPYFEVGKGGVSPEEVRQHVQKNLGLLSTNVTPLPEVSHSFTKFSARLYPFHLSCEHPGEVKDFKWMTLQELDQMAFPSGHRTIYQSLKKR